MASYMSGYPRNTKDNAPNKVPKKVNSFSGSSHLGAESMTAAGQNSAWGNKSTGLPMNAASITVYGGAVPDKGTLMGVPASTNVVNGSSMTQDGQSRHWDVGRQVDGYMTDASKLRVVAGTDPNATKSSRFKPLIGRSE